MSGAGPPSPRSPVPTRIGPERLPPGPCEVPLVRRTPRAQPDKRSPPGTRLALSPLRPHRANAISSSPRPYQRLRRCGTVAFMRAATAGLPMSPRINHVGGCFDDLPEGTVGTVVVNAPSVVRTQFLQHAEADEPTEFLGHLSLQDHFAGWFGLVETRLVMPDYPEGER